MSRRSDARRAALVCSVLGLAACDGVSSDGEIDPPVDATSADGAGDAEASDAATADATARDATSDDAGIGPGVSLDAEGLWLRGVGAWIRLRPAALVDGAWRGGGTDGPCAVDDNALRCPAGGGGAAWLRFAAGGELVRIDFEATAPATIEGLALVGEGELPGARAWLSNGLQSWSQSGVLALGEAPDDAATARDLRRFGDLEVVRTGATLSWWHTFAGGGPANLVAGATDARRFLPWAQVHRGEGPDGLRLRFGCGGAGERVAVGPGEAVEGEPWRIALGDDLEALLVDWSDRLPRRRGAARAEAGWNSWYELWDDVDAEAVRQNAMRVRDAFAGRLPPGAPPLRVTIDDGWQLAWGDWHPNDKFPGGLAPLAAELRAEGFTAGVWWAPLLVDADHPLVADHPDWFVRDLTWTHLLHGRMRVLDPTHPDAAAHLAAATRRIAGWGLDFLKIDFLFAGLGVGGRHRDVTPLAAYHEAMRVLREAAGEEVVLLAVGAPQTPSLPYVDAWRVGGDIAIEPLGASYPFLPNQLRSVAARWPVCRVTLCDADPVLLRELPAEQVALGAWTVAAAGGALFLSDDLRALDPARVDGALLADVAGPALSGRPAVPLDPYPESPPDTLQSAVSDHLAGTVRQVAPARWRLQDGRLLLVNAGLDVRVLDGVPLPPTSVRVLDSEPDR